MAARTQVDFRRLTHPTEYTDLRLRLLASRCLYQDAGLATLASLDQDPVGAWLDRDRPYLAFSQATVGNKPKLLVGATPAGGNAVRFTQGSNTVLSVALSATAGVRAMDFRVQEHTIVACLRPWEAPTGTAVLFAPNNAANWYGALGSLETLRHSYTDGHGNNLSLISSAHVFASGTGSANWIVIGWRLRKVSGDTSTGTHEQLIAVSNGSLTTTTRAESDTPTAHGGSTLNTTSTQWNLGALTSAANPCSVDLAELDVYGAALSDADLADLMGELVLQHGL